MENPDNKQSAPAPSKTLISLPSDYEGIYDFVASFPEFGEFYLDGTPSELERGIGKWKWRGDKKLPVLIGYPHLSNVRDSEGKVMKDPDGNIIQKMNKFTGIPLIELYWDKAKQGFFCVRGDVYEQ
jgi:hypothetical protein